MNQSDLQLKSESGPSAWLYREALQNDYADPNVVVRTSGMFYVRLIADRETQLRAYLCESLLTALEHSDPIIRVRAACRAFTYSGSLVGMGKSPGPRHCDALLDVRNRLEEMVR